MNYGYCLALRSQLLPSRMRLSLVGKI